MKYTVLTIAGFDSSGGAGLQADLKTIAAFGCYGTSVLTALPVQNTCGVRSCYEIPLQAIEDQLEVVFDDIRPHAIKIGMLFNAQIIKVVAEFLQHHAAAIPLVLDPVILATSGHCLLVPDAIDILKAQLIPMATIITPNIPEACQLSSLVINHPQDMYEAAQKILDLGTYAVLVKGGHLPHASTNDVYVDQAGSTHILASPRITTQNTHGTGCTLSSAIACCLAQDIELLKACRLAKSYVYQALLASKNLQIGLGHGPVDHFYHLNPLLPQLKEKIYA